MTWADYMVMVNEHLGVDANRRGTENMRNRAARDAVVDLQRFIEGYRVGHTKIYAANDLIVQNNAQLGEVPVGAIPQAFYIYSTKADLNGVTHQLTRRNRLQQVDWMNRETMIRGHAPRSYTYSISPTGRSFLIHPVLNDETELQFVWSGLKYNFDNRDVVPFPPESAEATAAYVKWKVLLDVDKRLDLAREQYALYVLKRLSLLRDFKDTLNADKPDDVDGRMLSDNIRTDINTWSDLAAIATASFTPPYIVGWVNQPSGILVFAELRDGTEESDPDNGIMRPDDYSPAVNAKVWHQIS